jgi:hypothetical protein
MSTQAVRYFRLDNVPGQYFECSSYGSLSTAACARNFIEAPAVMKTGRLRHCVGCAAGRQHAGADAPRSASTPASSIVYRIACCRCRRDARSEGTRLIGRLRLVRDHTICVSCYNREREVLVGANAKGAAPKKWVGLFRARAAYLAGTRVVVVPMPDPVVDRIEVGLTMIRRGRRAVAWARPALVLEG